MKLSGYMIVIAALATSLTLQADRPARADDDSPAVKRTDSAKTAVPANIRRFRFVYGATIKDLTPGTTARVWLPLATNNHSQKVERLRTNVPGAARETVETQYGNHLLYFEAVADGAGQIPIDIEYLVERQEVRRAAGELSNAADIQKFLAEARNVPVDGSLLANIFDANIPMGDPIAVARTLYDAVDNRMTYDKPANKPWGRGDALWACGSGYGNCSDFHSLFVGLCRDLKIPAKFEIGFPIPPASSGNGSGTIAGYHCWAKFSNGRRWVAVDISEADKNPAMKEYYFGNLTADRVTFSTGRDLLLEPRQAAGPVNFLVYPYVEVDGRQHTSFEKRFRYEAVN